jgi:inhibitor of KinA
LFAAGDYLQFEPISAEEFKTIGRQVQAGSYAPHITEEFLEIISHD